MQRVFADRADAGRALATALESRRGAADTIVLGLPRGGVPVAYEVAAALALPLDVLVVRKLGLPWQPELAMGAIASGAPQPAKIEAASIKTIANASAALRLLSPSLGSKWPSTRVPSPTSS